MSAYIEAVVGGSVIAGATSISAVMAWIYRRGRSEGTLEKSMQDNSAATLKLNSTVERLNESLAVGFREVHDRIDGHDVRIALAENDIQHLRNSTTAAAIVAHGG
jgi:hypothetical protein